MCILNNTPLDEKIKLYKSTKIRLLAFSCTRNTMSLKNENKLNIFQMVNFYLYKLNKFQMA